MSRKIKTSSLALLALASGVAGIAGPAGAAAAAPNDATPSHSIAPLAAATADATNKISVLVLPGGSIVREKGVRSVSHPSLGLYCLMPNKPAVVAAKLVPSVSVDWSTSSGNELAAYYRSSGSGCPDNNLAILTFTFSGGTAVLSDVVGFTVLAE